MIDLEIYLLILSVLLVVAVMFIAYLVYRVNSVKTMFLHIVHNGKEYNIPLQEEKETDGVLKDFMNDIMLEGAVYGYQEGFKGGFDKGVDEIRDKILEAIDGTNELGTIVAKAVKLGRDEGFKEAMKSMDDMDFNSLLNK